MGVCPRDRALGMHATSLSPGVLRMVGRAASDFSFAAASDLLWELAAVRVETKQVERCAEALGREVAADERAVAETVPSPAPTMYLGMDGTGVPVRPAEVEGRRGKQPDGSAKTREVKLATLWTAEGRDKQGRPVRDLGSVSYNASVESAASRDTDPQPAAFAQRVFGVNYFCRRGRLTDRRRRPCLPASQLAVDAAPSGPETLLELAAPRRGGNNGPGGRPRGARGGDGAGDLGCDGSVRESSARRTAANVLRHRLLAHRITSPSVADVIHARRELTVRWRQFIATRLPTSSDIP